MEPADLLRVLLPVYLLAFAAGAARRMAIYRQGATRAVPVWPALKAIPRRYFVDLHHKVDRDRYASIMHIAVAAGFLAATAILCFWLIWPVTALRWLGLAASSAMLAGAALVLWRRIGTPKTYPASRSGGQWARFGITLPLPAIAFTWWFATGGRWFAGLLLAASLFELIVGAAWYSPLRHALAGALNLGFHPRPDRFEDGKGRDTGLKPLDLDAPQLGVAKATEWDWTTRLNFDACVQCGRCEAACPAFAAGQPLNPKALIQDMIQASGLGTMAGPYAGADHSPIRLDTGTALIAPETLWSCTTCRACVEECPMMIEHVDSVIDLRRHAVLDQGALPGKGPEIISHYQASDTPNGGDLSRRFDWAAGLGLPVMSDTGRTDLLLWAGDAAFEARGQRTLRALIALLRQAGITPAILGHEERDSGDLARRLGDEATFQRLARANIETLSRYQIGAIVTPDPHVLHVMSTEYPSFGVVPEIRHHSQLLAELVSTGRLSPQTQLGAVTYHDPCYLGRYSGEYDAPRRILSEIAELTEMARSRHRSRCCGGGGGAPITDMPGERRIADMRMEDVAETAAPRVAVACPNCAVMLEGASGTSAEVVDIAELLAEATGATS